MAATWMSQTGKITRPELQVVPVPRSTATHRPLSHYEIVEALLEALRFRHVGDVGDECAVSRDGMRMFGVLDLEYGITGVRVGAPCQRESRSASKAMMPWPNQTAAPCWRKR
jgi:hypothetical protein